MKRFLRLSTIQFLFPNFYTSPKNKLVISDPEYDVFLGYYDKPAMKNSKLLVYKIKNTDNPTCGAELHLYNLKVNNFSLVDEVACWNYQQGNRAMWLSGEFSSRIIYNKNINYNCIGVIYDTDLESITEELPIPVYDISTCNRYVVGLDFARLTVNRLSYGYEFLKSHHISKDAILIYDRITKIKTIISFFRLRELINAESQLKIEDEYINHISFSPHSTTFIFFYIYASKGSKRNIIPFVANINGRIEAIRLFDKVSHFNWLKSKLLIIYAKTKKYGWGYYKVAIKDHEFIVDFIGKFEDGHPTYFENHIFVTDSYPDKNGYQELIISENQNKLFRIYSFYAPILFRGDNKSDLHPNLSYEKSHIALNVVESGKREVIVIKLKPGNYNEIS